MRVPVFDESLRTGQPLIDEQHEALFGLAARVADMMGECDPGGPDDAGSEPGLDTCSAQTKDAATEAVYGLLDYATEHFADEETLQSDSGYPLANLHASLHADLNRRLAPFVMRELNDEDVAPDKTAEFFIAWLTSHIMEHDRRFTDWLSGTPSTRADV